MVRTNSKDWTGKMSTKSSASSNPRNYRRPSQRHNDRHGIQRYAPSLRNSGCGGPRCRVQRERRGIFGLGNSPFKDRSERDRQKMLGPQTTILIDTWLSKSKIRGGKMFRGISRPGNIVGSGLSTASVRRIIKNSINEVGHKGCYSGHSLRVGSARSLVQHAASLIDLLNEGRKTTPDIAAHQAITVKRSIEIKQETVQLTSRC